MTFPVTSNIKLARATMFVPFPAQASLCQQYKETWVSPNQTPTKPKNISVNSVRNQGDQQLLTYLSFFPENKNDHLLKITETVLRMIVT